jgi:branched-chain amino acid transport system ATP-binding protein
VVFDGSRERLLAHEDVREFYLGTRQSEQRGYRDVKQYRRVRRWH